MRRRLLAALLTLVGVFAVTVAIPTAAHAATVQWYVHYGQAVTPNNSPNVWSDRVPIWDSNPGTPRLRFERDGNLRDLATSCPGGVCWQTNTSNAGPGPWQLFFDSRPGNTGDLRIYSSDSVIRFHTATQGIPNVIAVEFSNACFNLYDGSAGASSVPIWQNSTSSACYIYY